MFRASGRLPRNIYYLEALHSLILFLARSTFVNLSIAKQWEVKMSRMLKDSGKDAQPTRRKVLRAGAVSGLIGSGLIGIPGLARATTTASPTTTTTTTTTTSTSAAAVASRNHQCILKGSRVLTIGGEVKVEDLAVGDLVPSMFGGVRPVRWIGRYTLERTTSKPWPKDARPVRIASSALAPNVPRKDLWVSQAHALFVDGVLISAGYLVNGTTITLDEASERRTLEFFHVKLEKSRRHLCRRRSRRNLAQRGRGLGQFR